MGEILWLIVVTVIWIAMRNEKEAAYKMPTKDPEWVGYYGSGRDYPYEYIAVCLFNRYHKRQVGDEAFKTFDNTISLREARALVWKMGGLPTNFESRVWSRGGRKVCSPMPEMSRWSAPGEYYTHDTEPKVEIVRRMSKRQTDEAERGNRKLVVLYDYTCSAEELLPILTNQVIEDAQKYMGIRL